MKVLINSSAAIVAANPHLTAKGPMALELGEHTALAEVERQTGTELEGAVVYEPSAKKMPFTTLAAGVQLKTPVVISDPIETPIKIDGAAIATTTDAEAIAAIEEAGETHSAMTDRIADMDAPQIIAARGRDPEVVATVASPYFGMLGAMAGVAPARLIAAQQAFLLGREMLQAANAITQIAAQVRGAQATGVFGATRTLIATDPHHGPLTTCGGSANPLGDILFDPSYTPPPPPAPFFGPNGTSVVAPGPAPHTTCGGSANPLGETLIDPSYTPQRRPVSRDELRRAMGTFLRQFSQQYRDASPAEQVRLLESARSMSREALAVRLAQIVALTRTLQQMFVMPIGDGTEDPDEVFWNTFVQEFSNNWVHRAWQAERDHLENAADAFGDRGDSFAGTVAGVTGTLFTDITGTSEIYEAATGTDLTELVESGNYHELPPFERFVKGFGGTIKLLGAAFQARALVTALRSSATSANAGVIAAAEQQAVANGASASTATAAGSRFVLSGHGASQGGRMFTVPSNVTIRFHVAQGRSMGNGMANLVEQGTAAGPITRVYTAGQRVPEHLLFPIEDGMIAAGTAPVRTSVTTPLSAIVRRLVADNPGQPIVLEWAACRNTISEGVEELGGLLIMTIGEQLTDLVEDE